MRWLEVRIGLQGYLQPESSTIMSPNLFLVVVVLGAVDSIPRGEGGRARNWGVETVNP